MPDVLRDWWPAILLLTPLVIGGMGWAIRMGLASKSDLRAEQEARDKAINEAESRVANALRVVAETVGKVDSRVAKLEHDFQHLPTKEQVHKLEVTTTEMKGDVKAMNETVKGVAGTASRLESYLLSAERRHTAA